MLETIRFLKKMLSHPLSSKRKRYSLTRWIRWHLGSRLAPGSIVVDFVNDSKLIVKPGMRGATENIYMGLSDFKDMGFLLHVLREADLFIDIGSNVGVYTVLASCCCKASSISIEPIMDAFDTLNQNIKLNSIDNRVQTLNIGVGQESSILKFTNNMDCINHVVTTDEEHSSKFVEVRVECLDKVLEGKKPTLIKIDVEGFESQVIAGAKKTLADENLLGVIMELNESGERYGYNDASIHKFMLDLGFCSFDYDPFQRNLTPSSGKDSNARNTLYLRSIDLIINRLNLSPKFRVLKQEI
jgi:FkbM family methyltransferase